MVVADRLHNGSRHQLNELRWSAQILGSGLAGCEIGARLGLDMVQHSVAARRLVNLPQNANSAIPTTRHQFVIVGPFVSLS